MDAIFDWCVEILVYFAGVFGITYKGINVWVFVIIWPVVTLVLMIWLLVQKTRIRRLENLLAEKERGNND